MNPTNTPKPASPSSAVSDLCITAFDLALQEASFLAFVRALQIRGVEFVMRGKNPVLHHGSHRVRIWTAGKVPELSAAFRRWEGRSLTFQFHDLETKALKLRLQWIAFTNSRHDIPAEMRSLIYFTIDLGETAVADAMSIAFGAQGIVDDNRRFKYFCGVCHNSIRNRMGAADPTLNRLARAHQPPLRGKSFGEPPTVAAPAPTPSHRAATLFSR